MRFSETRLAEFNAEDGLKLDIHIWEPDSPKALFLAVHGGLAHAGDYVTPALFFKKKGIATVAYNLRGHKTKKVCINNFEQFVEDTQLFLKWVKNRYPTTPIFYLGHSIGSLIGTIIGLRSSEDDTTIKGYILSSPYYQNAIKINPFAIPMMKTLSNFFPNLAIPNIGITNQLTHDKTITKRHQQDEADGIRATKASIRFGREVFLAQDWVKNNIQKWKHSIFAVVAGNDKVADAIASERLLKKIDSNLLTYLFLPDNYHENYNEVDREQTFNKIYEWMTPWITG
ncbi:MAG: alpha/beta hydrolase [Desulfobacteraceae bacterium]|nr:alpha/beta hydrolase [Desulfobacteraceae bacterium]